MHHMGHSVRSCDLMPNCFSRVPLSAEARCENSSRCCLQSEVKAISEFSPSLAFPILFCSWMHRSTHTFQDTLRLS